MRTSSIRHCTSIGPSKILLILLWKKLWITCNPKRKLVKDHQKGLTNVVSSQEFFPVGFAKSCWASNLVNTDDPVNGKSITHFGNWMHFSWEAWDQRKFLLNHSSWGQQPPLAPKSRVCHSSDHLKCFHPIKLFLDLWMKRNCNVSWCEQGIWSNILLGFGKCSWKCCCPPPTCKGAVT